MLNLAIASIASLAVFSAVFFPFGTVPAVLPTALVFLVTLFLLTRRIGRLVEAEMEGVVPLLQARRISEALTMLRSIKKRYARWQFFLGGQMDAQAGMIDYLQLNWDSALPKLQRGTFRNWPAKVCIGAIEYRKGDKKAAFKTLSSAVGSAKKEPMAYMVWAVLLVRAGQREEALQVMARSLKAMPDNAMLKNLQRTVANKRKIDVKKFPETWYQFFPEELRAQHALRGRKGGPIGPQVPQPKLGAKQLRRR